VSKLGYSHGNLTQMKTWSALPDGFKGNTKASAIRLSFDGHWLLASNRGCDSIAVFRVLPNGDLIHAGFYPVWGESPRDFDFIGDGSLLAITNENTDNMVICGFDANTGAVSKAKQFFQPASPAVCSAQLTSRLCQKRLGV
jgi:6-phosphogluconolactonase